MSSFGLPPRPAPVPAPFIDMATYLAPTLSTIMRPDAERLASVVHSALIVHFSTDSSLDTWPVCLENHIANFLHGAQLPEDYVAVALVLLAQLSFDNPHLYAEYDDAECLFYGAMYTIALRFADHINHYEEAERYARFHFQFKDRRWKLHDWVVILMSMKERFDLVWDKCAWVKMLDIDTLVSRPRQFEREQHEYAGAESEWHRTRFFREVIRGVVEGDNLLDPEFGKRAASGSVGVKRCEVDCRLYCCFDRGDKYPLPNDARDFLPIHLAYRPWSVDDPQGGDYKHNTNGRLDIWTKGLKPEINPKLKFYNTVVEGPYQAFSVLSFRENGVPWNLNAEEKVMWKEWEAHLRRTALLPPSTDMERRLSREIRKMRELRLAVKQMGSVATARSDSGSGSGSGSGSATDVEAGTDATRGSQPHTIRVAVDLPPVGRAFQGGRIVKRVPVRYDTDH